MKKSIGWGFGRCNMNCKHCYNASCNVCPQYEFDVLRSIADKICPDIDSINYGTGEFGMNTFSLTLARYIKEVYPHVSQAVTTNGATIALLKPSEVREIFHDIDFSLDFPDPERHNEFRKHPKAWKWIMDDLEICKQEGIDTSIVTCVTGITSDDDIKELIDFAGKHNCSWRVNWFRPTGRGKSRERFRLTAQRVWDVLELISTISKIEALSDPLFDSVLGKRYNAFSGCACGEHSCRIQTSLEVTPCVFLGGKKWSGGSIVEKSLDEIFESDTFKMIRSHTPKFCLKCHLWATCRGGCTSRAILYQGGLNKPDGFCPFANGVPQEQIERIKSLMRIAGGQEKKVHDGYLCTLIVKP